MHDGVYLFSIDPELSYGRSGKRVGFNPAKMDSKDREAMAKFRRPAYYQQAKRLVAAQGRQLEEKDALAYLGDETPRCEGGKKAEEMKGRE